MSQETPGGGGNNPEPVSGRRTLLGFLLGSSLLASLASILYPILNFILPPPAGEMETDTVVAAGANELAPNAGKIFRFGNKPGLLVRTPTGEYRAYSATCTHLECTVQYRGREHDVWCACHNGVYDLQGRNVSGPPPRPLEVYDVHVQGDDVVVARRRS